MAKKSIKNHTKTVIKSRSLCSGWKCFPSGRKCPGCYDCVGKNAIKDPFGLLEKRMIVLTPKTKKPKKPGIKPGS